MRITNKVMQNNALSNINRNKELQDDLNTQIATGKKVYRPSDDPVVAIRALRLRTDVNQINQYYQKNIPDAQAWLSLTETSIKTTISVVKDIVYQCEKGSSDNLQVSDRQKIIDSMKALRDEIYTTGNSDYAGRYIFTGYRTDMALTFGKQQDNKSYSITEAFDYQNLEQRTYINTKNLGGITEANYGSNQIEDSEIEPVSYYRFRIAYNALDDAVPTLTVRDTTNPDPTKQQPLKVGGSAVTISKEANPVDAYTKASAPDAKGLAIYVPATGELVMSSDVYDALNNSKESVNITYQKSSWLSSDLRPEHYFYCETKNDQGLPVKYNPNYLENLAVSPDQRIEYQVGFDQMVQVNTYASDVYKHAIGRDVDEIIDLADQLTKAEAMVDKFKAMGEDTINYTEEERSGVIAEDQKAAEKAVTYLRDQLQKRFSLYITNSQGYLDAANEAVTVVGNRSKRVELAENRLSEQQSTFKELQSNNEDADATEVAVQLSSAEVSYEAALMATSQMIKTTLLNYI